MDTTATFLVVEDNDLDLERIRRGFSRRQITNPIVRAKDGYEAFDILHDAAGECDGTAHIVVLLDLNMPRMSGYEFLEKLRADATLAGLPVFVLSTSDRETDMALSRSFDVRDYFVKPIDMEQLFKAMASLGMKWTLRSTTEPETS